MALTAAQWRTAAVTPATVDQWRAAGIGPGEAVRWHEFGVDLKRAVQIKSAGRGPESAMASNQAVTVTRSRQDSEVHEAFRRFHEAGVSGQVVHSYITIRWRAGIPFDEVADWIGAGLTATEAVEQRAAGVTVEQAAALRALRNPST